MASKRRPLVAPYGNPAHDAVAIAGGVLVGLLIGWATLGFPGLPMEGN